MKQLVGADQAAEELNKYFPEVTWDRFVSEDGSELIDTDDVEMIPIYTLYGWVEREDAYKDFVIITFTWGGNFTYYTSSAKYSKIFHERIHGEGAEGHTECERVEDFFPKLNNVVRLNK